MKRPKITTVLICFGLFLFFLILRFPFQNLRGFVFGKIYKETGIQVAAADLYLSIFGWPGVGMRNVDVSIPVGRDELDVSAEKLVARVGLGGLIPPRPSVSVNARGLKKGGDVWVKVTPGKTNTSASFDAEAVNLEQFAFAGPNQLIRGKLQGDGSFFFDASDLAKSSGNAEFSIEKLKTPAQNLQGIVIPDVDFGTLKSKINIKNGVVEISSFQMGDAKSDIQGSIAGEVRLGKDIARSFLNITLKLQLSPQFMANPNSETIVSVLNSIDNSKPGTYAMKWSTSIEGITSNLWNALPKKVSQ